MNVKTVLKCILQGSNPQCFHLMTLAVSLDYQAWWHKYTCGHFPPATVHTRVLDPLGARPLQIKSRWTIENTWKVINMHQELRTMNALHVFHRERCSLAKMSCSSTVSGFPVLEASRRHCSDTRSGFQWFGSYYLDLRKPYINTKSSSR